MNLFRLVHFESYQCGSLAAIRYVARAANPVRVTYLAFDRYLRALPF
jgi:hypothetical protein